MRQNKIANPAIRVIRRLSGVWNRMDALILRRFLTLAEAPKRAGLKGLAYCKGVSETEVHRRRPSPAVHQLTVTCPECGSTKTVKNGLRDRQDGSATQRFRCSKCSYRFSENYNRVSPTNNIHQLSATLQEAKKLGTATETKTVAGDEKDLNGKIVEYLCKMERQGYSLATRKLNSTCLRILTQRGANLADPETVKEVLARQSNPETAFRQKPWGGCRKRNMINAYTQFLKFVGLTWEAPRNTVIRKNPFIPTEQELDDLIAGTPKTVSTMLQLLKETAMRSGEAAKLRWKDVDIIRKVIMCNDPEKGSNPRVFGSVTEKLLIMLNQMPRINEYVFGEYTINSLKATFGRSRKRLAFKLGNPRLNDIHFHTFRHWKATMEYHYTKDILHVKKLLGHREIDNTQLYISLDEQLFQNVPDDKFTSHVAHTTEECCKLIDVGFEYICGSFEDGGKIFRKRK